MDLSKLYKSEKTEFKGYKIPACFELAGKCFDIVFDEEDKVRLDFIKCSEKEVKISGGIIHTYLCMKIAENMYLVSLIVENTCMTFVVDTENNLGTRLLTDESAKTEISLGIMADNNKDVRSIATDDFKGNSFEWTFGPEYINIVDIIYDDIISVTFPFLSTKTPDIEISDFSAVELAEGIYLQIAVVSVEGQTYSVVLATNLNNLLCRGRVFGVHSDTVSHITIGGYGRAV